MDAFIAFLRALTATTLENGNVYYDTGGHRFWLGIGATDWTSLLGELCSDGGGDKYFYVTKEVDTDLWWSWEEPGPDMISGMRKVKIDLYEELKDTLLFYGYYHGGTINQADLEKVIEHLIEKIENWEEEKKEKLSYPFWWYTDFEGFVS